MTRLHQGDILSGSQASLRAASPHLAKPTRKSLQAGFLMLVALVFGGGGSGAGMMNLVVQLVALAFLALNGQAVFEFYRTAPKAFMILVSATLALPILEIVPLPPAIWPALPGRTLVTQALNHVDARDIWFPISMSANRTAIAFFSLVPCFTILVLTRQLPEIQRRNLLLLIAACGVITLLLGAQQLAMGNRHLILYNEAIGSKDLQGTFSNHNTVALLLNISLVALITAFPARRVSALWTLGSAAMIALLLIGVILSRSRSGMFLLIVPAALAFWRWLRWSGTRIRPAVVAGAVLAVLLLMGAGALLLANNQRVRESIQRFDRIEDEQRPLIWEDTLEAIKRYWPVGSGIGSFDEVFQIDETLENLNRGRAARAHNDFLEVALESGIVGIGLVAAWLVTLGRASLAALRRDDLSLAALATGLLIGLQSITDYPMRSQTLLCFSGFMLANLMDSKAAKTNAGKVTSPQRSPGSQAML